MVKPTDEGIDDRDIFRARAEAAFLRAQSLPQLLSLIEFLETADERDPEDEELIDWLRCFLEDRS